MGLVSKIASAAARAVSSIRSSSKSSSSRGGGSPSAPSSPQFYKPGPKEVAVKGTAVIYDNKGNVQSKFATYVKDGAMYDQNTGQIVSSNHGASGLYNDPTTYEKVWDSATKTGYWKPINTPEAEKKRASGGGGSYYSPPIKPSFIKFNEPIPTFKSDLKQQNKFVYFAGIDSIELKKVETNKEVCFISKAVSIGKLLKDEYLDFKADYFCDENSSIEFYMIDGEAEIPILPFGEDFIKNEKIFFGLNTRFSVDERKTVIKKGTVLSGLTLQEAKEKETPENIEEAYNISYYTKSTNRIIPKNDSVKIKAIIRTYGFEEYCPYIKSMKFRKYGGASLWNQNI